MNVLPEHVELNGLINSKAAGRLGSACSPDGLLPLLRIRGYVCLGLFHGPLHLHFNDLLRKGMGGSGLKSEYRCLGEGSEINTSPADPMLVYCDYDLHLSSTMI